MKSGDLKLYASIKIYIYRYTIQNYLEIWEKLELITRIISIIYEFYRAIRRERN